MATGTAEPPARRRGILRRLWVGAYTACVLGPAALMLTAVPAGTTVLTTIGDALGMIGLGILGLQLLLPARWGPLTASFGTETLVRLHRPLATAGSLLVLGHVGALMIDDPSRLALLEVWSAPTRARLAVLATVALGGLVVSSVARARLRLAYETWRRLHLALGLVLVVGGTAHALLVGHFLAGGVLRAIAILLLALALAGVLFLRVGRPLALNARYRVERVVEEHGDAVTVQLRADGHAGVPFAPGQFAWIKAADRRFGIVEHPFSFASSAHRPDRPSFTVRPVGDFTARTLRELRGRHVLLDGPHGSWTPEHPERGLLLLASGIGITPAMSVLRTLADERRSPPVTLVYASRDPDAVVFESELEDLARRLPLQVVHLPGRSGGRRRLDADLLQATLGPEAAGRDVLICGSPRFTGSAIEAALAVGVPRRRIHADEFALV